MRQIRGLTLIELMLVLAVLGILTAVAIPVYRDYVIKTRRSDAMNALNEILMQQEIHRTSNTTYATTLPALGLTTISDQGYYNLALPSASASTFTATATPTGAQAGDSCGTFAIDVNGSKTTGVYASSTCWRR